MNKRGGRVENKTFKRGVRKPKDNKRAKKNRIGLILLILLLLLLSLFIYKLLTKPTSDNLDEEINYAAEYFNRYDSKNWVGMLDMMDFNLEFYNNQSGLDSLSLKNSLMQEMIGFDSVKTEIQRESFVLFPCDSIFDISSTGKCFNFNINQIVYSGGDFEEYLDEYVIMLGDRLELKNIKGIDRKSHKLEKKGKLKPLHAKVDLDKDGFSVAQGDCDDNNQNINPSQKEICNNNVDDNCDGITDNCAGTLQDSDNDGVVDGQDKCPNQKGTILAKGCPDGDGDGIADSDDNCPSKSNADQSNRDNDNYGDACDNCPDEYGNGDNGCSTAIEIKWYSDGDGDQFGDPRSEFFSVNSPGPDWVKNADDDCPTRPGQNNGCPEFEINTDQFVAVNEDIKLIIEGNELKTSDKVIWEGSSEIEIKSKVGLSTKVVSKKVGKHLVNYTIKGTDNFEYNGQEEIWFKIKEKDFGELFRPILLRANLPHNASSGEYLKQEQMAIDNVNMHLHTHFIKVVDENGANISDMKTFIKGTLSSGNAKIQAVDVKNIYYNTNTGKISKVKLQLIFLMKLIKYIFVLLILCISSEVQSQQISKFDREGIDSLIHCSLLTKFRLFDAYTKDLLDTTNANTIYTLSALNQLLTEGSSYIDTDGKRKYSGKFTIEDFAVEGKNGVKYFIDEYALKMLLAKRHYYAFQKEIGGTNCPELKIQRYRKVDGFEVPSMQSEFNFGEISIVSNLGDSDWRSSTMIQLDDIKSKKTLKGRLYKEVDRDEYVNHEIDFMNVIEELKKYKSVSPLDSNRYEKKQALLSKKREIEENFVSTAIKFNYISEDREINYDKVMKEYREKRCNCPNDIVHTDEDGDGFPASLDCDDNNPNVYPGALVDCNKWGDDDNCDGVKDACCKDEDKDGFYSSIDCNCDDNLFSTDVLAKCDCDDNDNTVFPGAPINCENGNLDDNCDGLKDSIQLQLGKEIKLDIWDNLYPPYGLTNFGKDRSLYVYTGAIAVGIGVSYYFKSQSNKMYQDYKAADTFRKQSEYYDDANKYHRRFIWSALVTTGVYVGSHADLRIKYTKYNKLRKDLKSKNAGCAIIYDLEINPFDLTSSGVGPSLKLRF